MRVIIAGSRFNEAHPPTVRRYAEACRRGMEIFQMLGSVSQVVSGTCYGADLVGERWAEVNGIAVARYPADWAKLGRGAGYARNIQMAKNADALLALWDGISGGTAQMIAQAEKRGLLVLIEKP